MPAMIPRVRIHPPLLWAATKICCLIKLVRSGIASSISLHWEIPRVCSSMTSLYWNASTRLLKNRRTSRTFSNLPGRERATRRAR